MDFITTEFQKKEQDNRSKGQGNKRSLDERIQLRAGEAGSEKKKGEFVLKEVWDKRKEEGRCMKCGRNNHLAVTGVLCTRIKTRSCETNCDRIYRSS